MNAGWPNPLIQSGPIPLRTETGSTVQDPDGQRAKQTAREFEATLLGMLLKEMRQTMEPEGGLFPGDSGDVHGGLFDLYMGQYLADAGGVGLASALERQLRNTYASTTGQRPETTLRTVVHGTGGGGETAPPSE